MQLYGRCKPALPMIDPPFRLRGGGTASLSQQFTLLKRRDVFIGMLETASPYRAEQRRVIVPALHHESE